MISVLWIVCWIFLADSSARSCVNIATFVPVGEPGAICCPQKSSSSVQASDNVTWYRNGSAIPITRDTYSRIHQRGDLLWFNPAHMEDSGLYQCVGQNSTKGEKQLMVFNNSEGFCFNQEITYLQRLFLHNSGKLTCPDLDYFKNESTQLVLQWFKACYPGLFEDKRFRASGESLIINEPSRNDEGIYICQATYTHMGILYNVSRAINLTVIVLLLVLPQKIPVEIMYPKNNSIQVALGSSIVMECNASAGIENSVFMDWEFPDKYVPQDKPKKYIAISPSGDQILGNKFNISKVKEENYGQYLCIVWSFDSEPVAAYLMLERPVLNLQPYLIGGLVPLAFILLTALVRFFRVEIVLWYRESFQPLISKGVSDGKLYDAYVLYSQNIANCAYSMNIFVLKVLPEVLEKQCGYKLFIFGRDDLPGQAVVTVVDEAIRQSRRVILVLVPDPPYCSMQKPTFETEIAVYSALIRDGIKVILIELDKIKDYSDMPESIKYLQQKHGILTWKGDLSEKSQMATTTFWKNVRYQMPASKCPPSSCFPLLPLTFNSSPISEG
ncbi:Interleukin-1 receptor type 1 [Varanus komodoensis]|nr:Interleukin-1 receptor type 1 [Varanus komodoensis]